MKTINTFLKCCLNFQKVKLTRIFNSGTYQNFSSSSQPFPKAKSLEVNVKSEDIKLDIDLVNHLERTSLVDFDNQEALARLEEAIRFANTLFEVDTTGVEPLTTVLEDESVYLREDKSATTRREDILANAAVTEEDYFVAPPGNIPLEQSSSQFKK